MPFNYPTFDQIVLANRRILARIGGGVHQVINDAPLLYALDCITGPIFSVDQFPTLEDKACRLAFAIATGHVFQNGNKRTAVSALDFMLEDNGHSLQAGQQEVVDKFEEMATGVLPLDGFVDWVRSRMHPPPS